MHELEKFLQSKSTAFLFTLSMLQFLPEPHGTILQVLPEPHGTILQVLPEPHGTILQALPEPHGTILQALPITGHDALDGE